MKHAKVLISRTLGPTPVRSMPDHDGSMSEQEFHEWCQQQVEQSKPETSSSPKHSQSEQRGQ